MFSTIPWKDQMQGRKVWLTRMGGMLLTLVGVSLASFTCWRLFLTRGDIVYFLVVGLKLALILGSIRLIELGLRGVWYGEK